MVSNENLRRLVEAIDEIKGRRGPMTYDDNGFPISQSAGHAYEALRAIERQVEQARAALKKAEGA